MLVLDVKGVVLDVVIVVLDVVIVVLDLLFVSRVQDQFEVQTYLALYISRLYRLTPKTTRRTDEKNIYLCIVRNFTCRKMSDVVPLMTFAFRYTLYQSHMFLRRLRQ